MSEFMYRKVNSCQACLSSDRQLQPIKDLKLILCDAINDLQLSTVYGGLCWECITVIKKYKKLKAKCFLAQQLLGNLNYRGSIISQSSLNSQPLFVFDWHPDNENSRQIQVIESVSQIKWEQIQDFKEEPISIEEFSELNRADRNKSDGNELNTSEDCMKQENIEITIDNIIKLEETVTANSFSDGDSEDDDTPLNKVKKDREKLLANREKAKGKYDCIWLTKKEVLDARQRKVAQPNYISIEHKCEKCILGFLKKDALENHMEKNHDPSIGEYRCDICESYFSTPADLELHTDKHYTVYKCKLCKYQASRCSAIVYHCLLKHSEDTDEAFHCHFCVTVYSSQEELHAHVDAKHNCVCHCGARFKDKTNLKRHRRRIHGSRTIICDYCKRTFKTKQRLEAHITKHDETLAKKLSYCAVCNVQYKNIYIYRSHFKSATKHVLDGFTCSVCKKTFASKVYWRQHHEFYHLKKSRFKCEICNKIFISRWKLKGHNQTAHGEERPKNHECNVCSKKFFAANTLRAHQLTHSSERGFMCSQCGDTFKQRPALYNHTRLVHPTLKSKDSRSRLLRDCKKPQ